LSAPPALAADGRGRLVLGGARYLLIRPETLVGLQKAVEGALGERAAACIAAGGRAGGAKAASSLERLTATELAVSVRGSAVAEAYGPSTAPVCHLIRGVLESLAAATFGRPSTVVETACAAMGAPACRFVAS
jgi:V4R domain